ncbi:MAG TPA: glucose 1-dehydrogenase [Acidobacteriaceae bacterium]|nr:glucose 1-dehydrogenase [Acidobacteriaceae bacterium]
MKKLQGKVAVITGASKGIGASISEHLAAEGASVVVNYAASQSGAQAVADRIAAKGGNAITIQADVSQPADIERLFARTRDCYGTLDILVNNAGIFQFAPLDAATPDHIRRQFELNVIGLLLTTQAAVRLMGSEGGSIVNIGSIVGSMPAPNASAYSATKAAVDAITISLSQELGPRKIRVNSLDPGMVETEGLRAAGLDRGEFREHQDRNTPLGRIAQPEDIALAATFLASDDARWITGQIIVAAGGMRT